MLALGLSLLSSVGYELWGTGFATARVQNSLKAEIRQHGFPPRPIPGGAAGFIRIPKIALNMAFVQGIGSDALAKGPGHYPRTPLPGEGGNVAIAGHRITHLAPFWNLNALTPGDKVVLQTREGTFVYRVVWQRVLPPDSWWVTAPTRASVLTLTTCNPRFSDDERLVVRAALVYGPSPRGFVDKLGSVSVESILDEGG
jgi:sortase A